MVHESRRFFDLLYSNEFVVTDARIVNDETMQVRFKSEEEFKEQNNKVNVVIASFTTAYARLKLYDLLDLLQERVLYYDTDSVIYVHKPNKPDPPLGNYLGDLTNELKDDDYITSFVSGGPKNYGYDTKNGKSKARIRGITMDYATSAKLNPNKMVSLVRLFVDPNQESEKVSITRDNIVRDKKEKKIYTKRMKKDYRPVYNKRVVKENYETVPYGY